MKKNINKHPFHFEVFYKQQAKIKKESEETLWKWKKIVELKKIKVKIMNNQLSISHNYRTF